MPKEDRISRKSKNIILPNKFIIFENEYIYNYLVKNFNFFKINKFVESLFNFEKKIFYLFVCTKDTIKNYNKNFRGLDKETDVLSFPLSSDKIKSLSFNKIKYKNKEYKYIGDILLCPEILLNKAIMENDDKDYLFLYMLVHSYLHLLGFEHETEDQYKIIEAKTESIIFSLINE
ncbi:MAG: rRNA maturation RNase YbeY [Spirochaetes bacterium]|nr:rRNA maturation RNase YbeY [Spirochaetota bacterium]